MYVEELFEYISAAPFIPLLRFTSNWKIYLCLLKYEFIPSPHFDAFCCIKAEALELSVKCGNMKLFLKEFGKCMHVT
jgi:hypothetical protein